MNKTLINWCDMSWNPITGCTKIAQGCKNCYAETIAKRFWKNRDFSDVRFHGERLDDKSLKSKAPKRIFVNSMSDLFHEKVNPLDLARILNIIGTHQQHTFLVLTKRIKRASGILDAYYKLTKQLPYPNLWLGYSASTQKDLDDGILHLFDAPTKIKWLSLEPLLEQMVIPKGIDWCVIGCESGAKRRYCDTIWIKEMVSDCQKKNIPVWIKQIQIGLKRDVTETMSDFPTEIQLRQLPVEI